MNRTATALLLSIVAAGATQAGECRAPKFTVTDFKTGDGTADRGFPGGVSLIDADGDGDLDVMATQGYDVTQPKYLPRRSMLYLNDGRAAFTRAEDSALSGTIGPASGSTWADIDRDGDLDAFVSTQLGAPDAFFRSIGKGSFERQELGDATKTKGGNFTASWVDIDGDGDLDLYVGGPTLEPPGPALVYRNDNGAFVRVTGTPLENGGNNPGAALWADLDNDGDPDLLLTNSSIARESGMAPTAIEHTVIYRNDGNWKFTRATGNAFESNAFPATTAALGDIDNDGDLDLFLGLHEIGKSTKRDRLFLNDGHGRFAEAPNVVLQEHAEQQYAAAMADFDLDGNLDLIAAAYNAPVAIFMGDGAAHVAQAPGANLAERKRAHASIATGDLNGDGRPDALIASWSEQTEGDYMSLLINETPPCGAWSEIVLRDAHGAPNPPGARVTLITRADGGKERRQLREAGAQTGLRSQNGSTFLFAIPRGEKAIAAEIKWPGGNTQRLTSIKSNARTEVRAQY